MKDFKDLNLINNYGMIRVRINIKDIPKDICIVNQNNIPYSIKFIFNNLKEAKHFKFKNLGLTDDNKAYLYGAYIRINSIGIKPFYALVYKINTIKTVNKCTLFFDKYLFKMDSLRTLEDLGLSYGSHPYLKEDIPILFKKTKQGIEYPIRFILQSEIECIRLHFKSLGLLDNQDALLMEFAIQGTINDDPTTSPYSPTSRVYGILYLKDIKYINNSIAEFLLNFGVIQ